MPRQTILTIFAALFLATTVATAADEDRLTGSAGVAAGLKDLDGGWEPLGDQSAFVLSLTIGKSNWPVQIAIDLVKGSDREARVAGGFVLIPFVCCVTGIEVTAESETTEWDLGVRRFWRQDKKFRPYAGGGIAFLEGELRISEFSVKERSSTTGYWLDTGFRLPLGSIFESGFDLRYSKGEVQLVNGDVDVGGKMVLLYLGGRW